MVKESIQKISQMSKLKRETDEYVIEYDLKKAILRILLLILVIFTIYLISSHIFEKKNNLPVMLNHTLIDAQEEIESTIYANSIGDLFSKKENVFVEGEVILKYEDSNPYLYLTNFKITNNKNLYIALSTNSKGNALIEISKMDANIGNFKYQIPEKIDLNVHNYILIWDNVEKETNAYAKLN